MTRDSLLSICINTRNRAGLLGETLDSLVGQMIPGVEIVVLDGASEDNTSELMSGYAAKYPFIRHVRWDEIVGIDEGYDLAVKHATGRYCWLMTDDDLIVEGALEQLVDRVRQEPDLIVMNMECFTKDFTLDLQQRFFKIHEDRAYFQDEFEQFLDEVGYGLAYIGCVVIKRSLWYEKDRTRFVGSYFIHVGVILGSTMIKKILFVHRPLIKYRSANSSWTARSFEIWYFRWPELVWSFTHLSDGTRKSMADRAPWRRPLTLLKSRAMGEYNTEIFRRYLSAESSAKTRLISYMISKIPVTPLSLLLVVYCLIFKRSGLYTLYCLMMSSPYPILANSIIWIFGVKFPLARAPAVI